MRNRYYDPAVGQFHAPDPIGYSGGHNLFAYGSGDPVNGWDPYGTDWVKIIGNEVVWEVTAKRGRNTQVIRRVTIGTVQSGSDGRFVNLNKEFGGTQGLDIESLRAQARTVKVPSIWSPKPTDGTSDTVIKNKVLMAASSTDQHSMSPGTDMAIGAARVAAEPVNIGRSVAKRIGLGRDLTLSDLDRYNDSMLVWYAAGEAEAGKSTWEIRKGVFKEVFVRGNPLSGTVLSIDDINRGLQTGDYERVGAGTFGVMVYAPALKSLRISGPKGQIAPTFSGALQNIKTGGIGNFAKTQFTTMPTLRNAVAKLGALIRNPKSIGNQNLTIGELAQGAIPDNALVNFGSQARFIIKSPSQGAYSYWFRFGDIKNLTLAQVRAVIGEGAHAGQAGGANMIRVSGMPKSFFTKLPPAGPFPAPEFVTKTPVPVPFNAPATGLGGN